MILNIDLIYQLGKKKWVKSKKSGGNRLPSEGDFILFFYFQQNLSEPFNRYMHLISVKQKVALRFAEKGRKTVE